MKLTKSAPAKINLYLDVTGIRDNGYHNIKSVMQTVDLYDIITVETSDFDQCEITLTCTNPQIPTDEKNIAYKAAAFFFYHGKLPPCRCHIHIEKNIPMEAGLAGGSTDAAAVLKILNEMYGYPLSDEKIYKIASILGADVPFCISGGTKLCEGIGEILTPMPSMPDCYITLARGGEGISTPAAYALVDDHWNRDFTISGGNLEALSAALRSRNIDSIAAYMYNIFEAVVLPSHATASRLREIMNECGAVGAMMSGSGPSVFGIFKSKSDAETAVLKSSEIASAFLCSPVEL